MNALRLVLVLLLSGAPAAVLACGYPAPPSFPTDERISKSDERAIKGDMIRYITEMSNYVACVQADHAAAVESDAPDESLALLAARNNVAVAELEAVRDLYVAHVGPIEELLFEQSFDSGRRRSDAAPQLPPVPRGSDFVLQRAKRIRGGADCAEDASTIVVPPVVMEGAPPPACDVQQGLYGRRHRLAAPGEEPSCNRKRAMPSLPPTTCAT